jgi:hypothetical protein
MNNTAAHQDATVTPLLSKDLADAAGKELAMIRVEYAPGASDPVHTHPPCAGRRLRRGGLDRDAGERRSASHARAGRRVLRGARRVHVVGRNLSQTAPASFVVFLAKEKGAPILTLVK